MPTIYGNDIVYCLKSHCGVRGYCRQKWGLQVQIIFKFSNERTCKRNKDVQGLSCGFEDCLYVANINKFSWFCKYLLLKISHGTIFNISICQNIADFIIFLIFLTSCAETFLGILGLLEINYFLYPFN